METPKIHVGMGEGRVASWMGDAVGPQVLISAGIGSCVVVTLYNPRRRDGGMAHVMLPTSAGVGGYRPPYQCADTAIPALLEGLEGEQACRKDIVAKMVGGAKMFASYDNGSTGIGAQIICSIKEILVREQIPLVGWDIAGHHGRTVEFHLASGQLVVTALGKAAKQF